MPSRINSTTTSPGGLISTGDSDNSLLIQTGDTTAITISNTQVVSLTNPLPVGSGGTGATTGLTALNASNLTSGTVPDARFPATLPAASGANLTSLNASNLSSGTVGTARLGSGTANNTTFLRGDGTWAVAGGTVNIQDFTSTGTWTKPSSGTMCAVLLIGGGGGGGRGANNNGVAGGSGARPVLTYYRLTDLPSTVTVTIGAGGSASGGSTTPGGNGGTSSFGTLTRSYGGFGGFTVDSGGNFYQAPEVTDSNSVIDTLAVGKVGGEYRNSGTVAINQVRNSDGVAIGANGGAGGSGASTGQGTPTQNFLGSGGNGSTGSGATAGTGYGSGGGTGATNAGAGAPGFCRVTVW